MPEINLLPDEFRKREQKEIESARKKPKVVTIEMSAPNSDRPHQAMRTPQPSLLSRLFAKRSTPPKPLPVRPEVVAPKIELGGERSVRRELHIPRAGGGGSSREHTFGTGVGFEPTPEPVRNTSPRSESPSSSSFGDRGVRAAPATETVVIKHVAGTGDKKKHPSSSRLGLFRWFSFGRKRSGNTALHQPYGQSSQHVSYAEGDRISPSGMVSDRVGATHDGQDVHDGKGAAGKEDAQKRVFERSTPGLDVNLIPEELAKYPEIEFPKKVAATTLSVVIMVLLVVSGYLGLEWYQFTVTRQLADTTVQVDTVKNQISQFESSTAAALDVQRRLTLVRDLLNRHIYWTEFFSKLEHYTVPDVFYTNFSMAGQDQLVISAIARDYSAVAVQLVAFQQATDFVTSVRIESASAQPVEANQAAIAGVDFTINLEFVPGIFTKPFLE